MRSIAKRQEQRTAAAIGAVTTYGGAHYIGGRMADDIAEGEDTTIEVMGKELPKYEAYGGVVAIGTILMGKKLSPMLASGILGLASGVAGGAAAVRNFQETTAGE